MQGPQQLTPHRGRFKGVGGIGAQFWQQGDGRATGESAGGCAKGRVTQSQASRLPRWDIDRA
jgi:hypothetical protein